MNQPVKFEVKPTSTPGHSLLVLPGSGLSLQMETDLAKRLAHAANNFQAAVSTLMEISEILNPDNEQSYRCDDQEGAMDSAFYKANATLDDVREP